MIRRNEIYLANFPFGDVPGMKLRPVLTLSGPLGVGPEVLVAYISSVVPTLLLTSDIILDLTTQEHATTNLRTKSARRLHKLATIHTNAVVRRLGILPSAIVTEVEQKLRILLKL